MCPISTYEMKILHLKLIFTCKTQISCENSKFHIYGMIIFTFEILQLHAHKIPHDCEMIREFSTRVTKMLAIEKDFGSKLHAQIGSCEHAFN